MRCRVIYADGGGCNVSIDLLDDFIKLISITKEVVLVAKLKGYNNLDFDQSIFEYPKTNERVLVSNED